MEKSKKIVGSMIILLGILVFLSIGYKISNINVNDNDEIFIEDNKELVKEEEKITVYISGEVKKTGVYTLDNNSRIDDIIKLSGGFTEDADKTRINLAKRLKDEEHVIVFSKKQYNNQVIHQESLKVDINYASKEELMKVDGIGEKTAEKIINYREENGYFTSIDELLNVDRIGEKTLDKLKKYVEIR